MAALGQLSANIAHEINTPLGSIKAAAEINNHLANDDNWLEMYKNTTQDKDISLAVDFIRKHKLEDKLLTFVEKRETKETLLKSLTDLQLENPRMHVDQLLEIEVYKLPEFLTNVSHRKVPSILNFIHQMILPKN